MAQGKYVADRISCGLDEIHVRTEAVFCLKRYFRAAFAAVAQLRRLPQGSRQDALAALAFDFRAHPIKYHTATAGFAPSEGFGLNTNLCGRSWSCATAAMAS
jgi:hypothetical protein